MDIRELENLVDDMAASARSLAEHLRKSSPDLPLLPLDAPAEVHQARQNMLRNATKIQTLLIEPANIVQNIAIQVGALPAVQCVRPNEANRPR
jgi:phosphoglycerate-specific signal transduction histidine kinase